MARLETISALEIQHIISVAVKNSLTPSLSTMSSMVICHAINSSRCLKKKTMTMLQLPNTMSITLTKTLTLTTSLLQMESYRYRYAAHLQCHHHASFFDSAQVVAETLAVYPVLFSKTATPAAIREAIAATTGLHPGTFGLTDEHGNGVAISADVRLIV